MTRVSSLALALTFLFATPAAAQGSPSRAALAHQLYDGAIASLTAGSSGPSDAYDWSVRWMRADLEAHVPGAAQAHLDRMRDLESRVHALTQTGVLAASAETACRYYVAEAQAWLAHPPS